MTLSLIYLLKLLMLFILGLQDIAYTSWIDVCPNNGSLLATAGEDQNIKIYDRREAKIAKIFDKIHSRKIIMQLLSQFNF